jgi:hypothetical protein
LDISAEVRSIYTDSGSSSSEFDGVAAEGPILDCYFSRNRGLDIMILKPRLTASVFLSLTVLGFAGCAEDNDATARGTVTSNGAGTEPIRSQEEYGKQRAAGGVGTTKANNYPGAKN